MKNLKKIVQSDAAYEILDNSNCAGTTWMEGGCAILARALNMYAGYPMYVIFNKKYNGPEHFGVKTPSGSILDGLGEYRNETAWLNNFIQNELPREGELSVVPYSDNMNMGGVEFDDKASAELANLIKNHQNLRETVRKVLRNVLNENEKNKNFNINHRNKNDIWFHGSKYPNLDINNIKINHNSTQMFYGDAFYVASDIKLAKKYGNYIYAVKFDGKFYKVESREMLGTYGTFEQYLEALTDSYKKNILDNIKENPKYWLTKLKIEKKELIELYNDNDSDTLTYYFIENNKDELFNEYIENQISLREEFEEAGFDGLIDVTQAAIFKPKKTVKYLKLLQSDEIKEDVEFQDDSDEEDTWDRVKIIARNKSGKEVGYAILDMAMLPEYEFRNYDGEGSSDLTDDEIEQNFPDEYSVAKLEHLEVYPQFRQKGFGKELMDAAVRYVKKRGYKTIYLLASPMGVNNIELDALTDFYKGYGFEIIKDYGNSRGMVSQMKEEIGDSKFSDDYDFSKHSFTSGDCDIYAISLHRLYGYPIYVVRGWYLEPDLGQDEIEWEYEDSHMVVKLPNGNYMDSHGETTEAELRQNCAFSNDIAKITFEPLTEKEALFAFSCQDQEADVQKVMNYIKTKNIVKEEREVEGINDKTKLSVFDFDKTLVMTPEPEEGAKEWEEKTGTKWEGRWWDNPDSLNTKVFDIKTNPSVVSAYKKEKSNPHNLVVMMTGRIKPLGKYVEKILDMNGLKFDDYLYKEGAETSSDKMKKMELALKYNPNIREIEMWDDRTEHIPIFKSWGDTMIDKGYLDNFKINHVK